MNKKLTILIVILIFIVIVFIMCKHYKVLRNEVIRVPTILRQQRGRISQEEKEAIETWIKENDLNQYGDPKDTVYIGGTPLFNEKTGKTIDRYEYILRRHPDRPWKR